MILESINEMIKQIINNCKSWIKEGEDGLLRFVDPIDGEEISAHYGATHAAASFIIYGERNGNVELSLLGYKLLESILKRWKDCIKLPAFHNDFNNFALCFIWEYLNQNKKYSEYTDEIKDLILATPDSNNPTVNWLPMRWYVNLIRYKWTSESKYKAVCDKCRHDIKTATYEDGFIDDRLPIGLSFNLQYDVATVSILQFLRSKGEDINISLELGALINVTAPDGDINYLGRGTNQIFAWGLWVYLLSSAGKEEQVNLALNFLKDKVPVMLKNHNLMLNDWPGQEKNMWWDYHYCSVYTAHFLFWLIMAQEQKGKYPIQEKIIKPSSSGLRVYKSLDYFVVLFDGRKEYLAENGPCLAAVWTKSDGMIIKGTFGPWLGAFGNKYSQEDITIRNYCGLFKISHNIELSKNRYIRKLIPNISSEPTWKISPVFTKIDFCRNEDELIIKWNYNCSNHEILSVPCFNGKNIYVTVNGLLIPLQHTSKIKNQYSWVDIYQTRSILGNNVELRIKL